ncbi:heterokaryon incompatibility protein-domain-containing protein [Tricladium varicosporioides]|nr:heterokaryon incompatibility protein-domain-containing protein [Hymenoscyphus varicosporioides]
MADPALTLSHTSSWVTDMSKSLSSITQTPENSHRLNALEKRIQNIENSLNTILGMFNMPTLNPLPVTPFPVPDLTIPPSTAPYTYTPLNPLNHEIRVLVVYSSESDDDPIMCSFVPVSLEADQGAGVVEDRGRELHVLGNFKALSYTWGSMTDMKSIILEGHLFPVTNNLHSAMLRLRNLTRDEGAKSTIVPSYWWIDAICIDQNNIEERNEQVTLMTRIYKKSSGVHIWLGESAQDSDLAMDLVNLIGDAKPIGPGDKLVTYPNHGIVEKIKHWEALTALFQRPYWNRVWVRQEVATPKMAVVSCGDRTCGFDKITMMAELLNVLNEQLGYQPLQHKVLKIEDAASATKNMGTSCYARASTLAKLRLAAGNSMYMQTTNYMELKDLLFQTRACDATDLRDKVFSMLGLVDPEIYNIKPDYRLSLHETIVSAAQCIISKTQNLDLLSACQNLEKVHGLPSWAPNLLDDWKCQPFETTTVQTWKQDMRGATDFIFVFEGGGECVLRTKGRKDGKIVAISEDSPNPFDSLAKLDDLYAKWKNFVRISCKKLNYKKDSQEMQVMESKFLSKKSDQWWLWLISGWNDIAYEFRYADDGRTLLPDQVPAYNQDKKMVESVLLPDAGDETAVEMTGKRKIYENLRKYGIGRTVAILEGGHVAFVPKGSIVGDDYCSFRNTSFAYILRKQKGTRYTVVGEACCISIETARTKAMVVNDTFEII